MFWAQIFVNRKELGMLQERLKKFLEEPEVEDNKLDQDQVKTIYELIKEKTEEVAEL